MERHRDTRKGTNQETVDLQAMKVRKIDPSAEQAEVSNEMLRKAKVKISTNVREVTPSHHNQEIIASLLD